MKGSRNITLLLTVLFYYTVQLYRPVLAAQLHFALLSWHVALAFFVVSGALFRRLGFAFASITTIGMFGFVMAAQRGLSLYPATMLDGVQQVFTTGEIPVRILLYILLPMMFFAFTFDSYNLVRDVAAVTSLRSPAHLLAFFCFSDVLRSRFARIAEHLLIRGVNMSNPIRRLGTVHRWATPLISSLVQGAAYRSEYQEMLGCSLGKYPARRKERRVSPAQSAFALGLWFLVVLRFFL